MQNDTEGLQDPAICPMIKPMRLRTVTALFVLVSCAVLAETYSGTLVDVSCKGKDLAKHTRTCAVACAKSGFGLVLGDGKFLKFDEEGNAKALAVLKASSKESDLKAEVVGKAEGTTLAVESVKLQ